MKRLVLAFILILSLPSCAGLVGGIRNTIPGQRITQLCDGYEAGYLWAREYAVPLLDLVSAADPRLAAVYLPLKVAMEASHSLVSGYCNSRNVDDRVVAEAIAKGSGDTAAIIELRVPAYPVVSAQEATTPEWKKQAAKLRAIQARALGVR